MDPLLVRLGLIALVMAAAPPLVLGSLVARRAPPPWLWVVLALLPILILPDGGVGPSNLAPLLLSAMGWAHGLVALRSGVRPTRVHLVLAGLLLVSGTLLIRSTGLGFSLGSIGMAVALIVAGPPSQTAARAAVPGLLVAWGAFVLYGAARWLVTFSDPARMALPPGGWGPPVAIGVGWLVVGLLAVRTRREAVQAGLTALLVAVVTVGTWVGDPVLLRLPFRERMPEASGLVMGDQASGRSRHAESLPADLDASTLRERLRHGPIDVAVQETANGLVTWGVITLQGTCSHSGPPRAKLEGTLGEVVASCPTPCVVDVPVADDHDSREAEAEALLLELRGILGSRRADRARLARLATELRTEYPLTHAVLEDWNELAWIPWERVGEPWPDDGLEWVDAPPPPAELTVVQVLADHDYPQIWKAAFQGRAAQAIVRPGPSRWDDPKVPHALDRGLPASTAAHVLLVRDGVITAVEPPDVSAERIRAELGIVLLPRAPIPEAGSPLRASHCTDPPPAPSGRCPEATLTCGADVIGHTGAGTRLHGVDWHRKVGMLGDPARGAGPEQVWLVHIPERTVAEVTAWFPCASHATISMDGPSPTCPIDLDQTWSTSAQEGEGTTWMGPGDHLFVVESLMGNASPYALSVRCSTAGEGVDTGRPPSEGP